MEIPKENFLVDVDQTHVEIMDTSKLEVWQSYGAISEAFLASLELDADHRLVSFGPGEPRAAMDAHAFRRSPGAEADGPLREREFGGERFIHCANPASAPSFPGGPDGPRQMLVDKHHSVVYRAGREVSWLRLPDGSEFVHVIEGGPGKPAISLPDGWTLSSEKISEERTIHLPHPTTAFFFPNGDSYQGPLER